MKLSSLAGLCLLAVSAAHAAPVGETFTYTGQPFDQFEGPEPNPFHGHSITIMMHFNTKLPHSKIFSIASRKGIWSYADGITTIANLPLTALHGYMRVRDNSVVTYAQFSAAGVIGAYFTLCDPVHCVGGFGPGSRFPDYNDDSTADGSERAVSTLPGIWALVSNGSTAAVPGKPTAELSRGLH